MVLISLGCGVRQAAFGFWVCRFGSTGSCRVSRMHLSSSTQSEERRAAPLPAHECALFVSSLFEGYTMRPGGLHWDIPPKCPVSLSLSLAVSLCLSSFQNGRSRGTRLRGPPHLSLFLRTSGSLSTTTAPRRRPQSSNRRDAFQVVGTSGCTSGVQWTLGFSWSYTSFVIDSCDRATHMRFCMQPSRI